MKSVLGNSKYVLDPLHHIWTQSGYEGIPYNDGDEIELRLASIIKQAADITVLSMELRQHCTDWPSLYHLSGTRSNILRPFAESLNGDILEVGAGCGAITRFLGECGANVIALEGSTRRAAIARSRTRDLANVTVVAEKFDQFQCDRKFDVITLIGVLEYANLFMPGVQPALSMLQQVRSLLKPEGRLIIAIENQLGLKYFAGAPEDHIGETMYGIEGRYQINQPQTFGRKVLKEMLGHAGFVSKNFILPFPDYKFPVSIVTEEGLNTENFDAAALAWQSACRDPQLPQICHFSLELAWPEVFKNDMALDMANSFLIVASPLQQRTVKQGLLALHYSTERLPAYCKETSFDLDANGEIFVRCQLLTNPGSINASEVVKFRLPPPSHYTEGVPLSSEFIQIVIRDGWTFADVDQFVRRYVTIICEIACARGASLEAVNSKTLLPGEFIDIIPQNILIKRDGTYETIDAEWTLNHPISLGRILFRAMLWMSGTITRFGRPEQGESITRKEFLKRIFQGVEFDLTLQDFSRFIEEEDALQEQITGRGGLDALLQWMEKPLLFHNTSRAVAERSARISTLNQTIAEFGQTLAKCNQTIAEHEQTIVERNQTIAEHEQIIVERERQLSGLYDSTSWRITSPLRVTVTQARVIKRAAKLVKPAIRYSGGIGNTIHKAMRIFLREGFPGIRRGFRIVATVHSIMNEKDIDPIYSLPVSRPAEEILSPRVLIIAEMSIPQCKKYRVQQKHDLIESLGVDCTMIDWTDAQACWAALQTHSLVIFYRVPAYESSVSIIHEAKRLFLPTIWEVDDLIFDRDVLVNSKTVSALDKGTIDQLLEGTRLYNEAMLLCYRGLASTAGLADAMKKFGLSEVHVVENALDRQTLEIAKKIHRDPIIRQDDLIRIVYGSGTNTHNIDFEEAAPAVMRVFDRFPNVRLRLIGPLHLSDSFARYGERIERLPVCGYEEYLRCLADCDISIAPLENYIFNDSKSNIKFIEASILKLPSVCSPRAAFTQVIVDGENGFLCEKVDEWEDALTQLVTDKTRRAQIGEAAYLSVMSRYAPDSIARKQIAPLFSRHKRISGKLRILSVNCFYYPRSFGGATIVAEEVNKLLNISGSFEMHVFTTLPTSVVSAYKIRRYEADGINIYGMGLPDGLDEKATFENSEVTDAFANILAVVQPDIVHFHSIQGIGISAVDLCVEKNIKYVITLHDAWWLCGRQFMITRNDQYCEQQKIDLDVCATCVENHEINKYRSKRLRAGLHNASLLLAPSRFFANHYSTNGFTNVVVNKNGVGRPGSTVRIRKEGLLRFGYVGGNTAIKGFHLVKKVFSDLTGSNVKLVLVDNTLNLGYASYHEHELADLPDVAVMPAYNQNTIDNFYAGIDVLLFPTQCKESFGLTVREALARNVWIITTDAGGVVEDIKPGQNGYIVPISDTGEGLKQAVVDSLLHFEQIRPGEEVSLGATDITFFEDQAAELAGILKSIHAGGAIQQTHHCHD